jgi:tryptophan synthase alpha chain
MGRIDGVFRRVAAERRSALITFVTAGDPDLQLTERLLPQMASAGADIIELGMPFSDPMADGPTIQLASERALAAGTTLEGILAVVSRVRHGGCQTPIVLMGYYNPVHAYGIERFTLDAAEAGVDALLIVDLPPEEAHVLRRNCRTHGLELIFLVAPTTGEERLARVLPSAGGFIYYVSVTGVTGAASLDMEEVRRGVSSIKARTDLPVVVGFGISRPDQAALFAAVADGVVVGSAIVRLFEAYSGDELLRRVTAFVQELRAALDASANS